MEDSKEYIEDKKRWNAEAELDRKKIKHSVESGLIILALINVWLVIRVVRSE